MPAVAHFAHSVGLCCHSGAADLLERCEQIRREPSVSAFLEVEAGVHRLVLDAATVLAL